MRFFPNLLLNVLNKNVTKPLVETFKLFITFVDKSWHEFLMCDKKTWLKLSSIKLIWNQFSVLCFYFHFFEHIITRLFITFWLRGEIEIFRFVFQAKLFRKIGVWCQIVTSSKHQYILYRNGNFLRDLLALLCKFLRNNVSYSSSQGSGKNLQFFTFFIFHIYVWKSQLKFVLFFKEAKLRFFFHQDFFQITIRF